jgi:hypothetical protein
MKHFVAIACVALAAATPIHALQNEGSPSANRQVNRDRIVCRRFLRTGSLVDSYRTCKTNREWQREHENLQRLSVSNSCRDQTGMGCLPQ